MPPAREKAAKAQARAAKSKAAAKAAGKTRGKTRNVRYMALKHDARKAPKKANFSGTRKRTAEGLISIDRRFTDKKAWEQRRQKEKAPPGGWPKPPPHWPKGVRVDIRKPVWWLPEGWGQGMKTTCESNLATYVSPEGRLYYHKHIVLALPGVKPGQAAQSPAGPRPDAGRPAWAKTWARDRIAEGANYRRMVPQFDADSHLFKILTPAERALLPRSPADLHFAVVSARRADHEEGLRAVVNVQSQLIAGGADPVWYVDAESLKDYKALGLNAKVGGKLVPARNLALKDAEKLGKPCVQVSDDISGWCYFKGKLKKNLDLTGLALGNHAAKSAERLRVSPAAAARFLTAKLRANGKAKLAGVFPLGNTGMAMTTEEVSKERFVLGDFFVTEGSKCRFDPRLTLKEDYDFTCAHLAAHGEVLRCNRMFAAAAHETNAGGAVSERDAKGDKERANIKVLQEKWPGVFSVNGRRGDTQVIMTWKRRKTA